MIPATHARRASYRCHLRIARLIPPSRLLLCLVPVLIPGSKVGQVPQQDVCTALHLERVFLWGDQSSLLAIKDWAGSVARAWRGLGGVTLGLLWKVTERHAYGVTANTSASCSLNDAMFVKFLMF